MTDKITDRDLTTLRGIMNNSRSQIGGRNEAEIMGVIAKGILQALGETKELKEHIKITEYQVQISNKKRERDAVERNVSMYKDHVAENMALFEKLTDDIDKLEDGLQNV